MSDMEKLPMIWSEDQMQELAPLCTMRITATAKSVFAKLKEKAEPTIDVEFSASSGCFK